MKTFDVGGINYGPAEVVKLRMSLIDHRDKALKSNDFGTAVLISHVVGVLYSIGKDVWGDDFKAGIPEPVERIR